MFQKNGQERVDIRELSIIEGYIPKVWQRNSRYVRIRYNRSIFQKTGQERVDMWELGTIESVGNLTCSREPFPHRASAHHEHKNWLRG